LKEVERDRIWEDEDEELGRMIEGEGESGSSEDDEEDVKGRGA
jgi:hypothetical protein